MALFGAKPRHRQADAGNGQAARGPGAQLTQARERWGMSREQVASTLRLPDRVIAALEQDHYEDLPPPAFVRGYISGYARLVGLDAPELIAACEMRGCGDPALAAKRSLSLHKGRGDTLLRWASYAVLITFLGSAVLYWADHDDSAALPAALSGAQQAAGDAAAPSASATDAKTSSTPAALTSISGAGTGTGTGTAEPALSAANHTPGHAPTNSPSESTHSIPKTLATAATDSITDADPANTPEIPLPTLELKFSADSWLAVTDADGKRLAWETIKAGSTRQLQGVPPLKVVLGNAAAVNISFQGTPFDPSPHTIGRMARFSVE